MSSFEPWRAARPVDDGFAPLAGAAGDPGWRPVLLDGAGAAPDSALPIDDGAAAGTAATAAAGGEAALTAAYERGVADGTRQAHARVEERLAAVAEGLAQLEAERASLRRQAPEAVLDLALDVARRILHAELAARPEAWLELIRVGVHKVVDRERICVRVGPELHDYLLARSGELRARLEDVKEIDIIADPAIPPTGCVVETAMGDVELGIDSQIAAVRAELEELA